MLRGLVGSERFKGLFHTKFEERCDKSTTWRNPKTGQTENPRVFSEMWHSDWWRDAEVVCPNLKIASSLLTNSMIFLHMALS